MDFPRVLYFIVLLQMIEACLIPRCCCPVPCPVPCPMPCPMPVGVPIPVPLKPCPTPLKPCCCFLTSPSMALATTTAPIGVPDVVVGSCGEVVVPLFNPPVGPLYNTYNLFTSTITPLTVSVAG